MPVSLLHPYVVAARLHCRTGAPATVGSALQFLEGLAKRTERIIVAGVPRALSPGVPTWQVPCRTTTASA